MEADPGSDTQQGLGQEASRAHPGFERSKRVLDSLPARLRGLTVTVKLRLASRSRRRLDWRRLR